MSRNSQLDPLFKKADRYCLDVLHLGLAAPNGSSEAKNWIDEMRVHFLFPNLSDRERHLIKLLRWTTTAVGLGMRLDDDAMPPEERKEHESTIREFEAFFVRLKKHNGYKRLMKKLTSTQREILRLFLSVPYIVRSTK